MPMPRGHCLDALYQEENAWVPMPFQKRSIPGPNFVFQWKCPLQNENGLALSKMKFKAIHLILDWNGGCIGILFV